MTKDKAVQQMQEDAKSIVAPGKRANKAFSVKLGKETFAIEEFCNYKSLLALQVLGEIGERVDLGPIINIFMAMRQGEDREVAGALLMIKGLPQLFKEAPDGILKFAALALIPNKKLAELYDVPNGIAQEIQRVQKLIGFKGETGLAMTIVKEALPHIGIDLLKNASTGLGNELGNLLPAEVQTPSAG